MSGEFDEYEPHRYGTVLGDPKRIAKIGEPLKKIMLWRRLRGNLTIISESFQPMEGWNNGKEAGAPTWPSSCKETRMREAVFLSLSLALMEITHGVSRSVRMDGWMDEFKNVGKAVKFLTGSEN